MSGGGGSERGEGGELGVPYSRGSAIALAGTPAVICRGTHATHQTHAGWPGWRRRGEEGSRREGRGVEGIERGGGQRKRMGQLLKG